MPPPAYNETEQRAFGSATMLLQLARAHQDLTHPPIRNLYFGFGFWCPHVTAPLVFGEQMFELFLLTPFAADFVNSLQSIALSFNCSSPWQYFFRRCNHQKHCDTIEIYGYIFFPDAFVLC